MREDLLKQLRGLIKTKKLTIEQGQEVLELYDDEVGDTSEYTAHDKAQQDIEAFLEGKDE
jgi:hypothetical protein